MVGESSANVVVEPVDGVVGAGHEHGSLADAQGVEVAVHGDGEHRLEVGGDVHPVVGPVGADRCGDRSCAQLGEGVVFPGFDLASVHGQFGDATAAVDRGGEAAAGSDLGELVVIADEDHPTASGDGSGDEWFEVDGGGHGSFVDDQHRGRTWSVAGEGPATGEGVEGGGVDAGAGLELGRGTRRGSRTYGGHAGAAHRSARRWRGCESFRFRRVR